MDQLKNSSVNEQRIQYVQQCFGNSGVSLASPGRVLVGEGVLTKLCRKKPKQRQFFLFNDLLVYGTVVIHKKLFKNQQVFELATMRIEDIPEGLTDQKDKDSTDLHHGWLITSPSKSFAVYAQTATEKDEWMCHMNRCISKLQSSARGELDDAAMTAAPTWVPDSDATDCMRCRKVHFTTIQRKHHCRKCGLVVCATCSSKKMMIPEQSDKKPLRVCDTCYTDQ